MSISVGCCQMACEVAGFLEQFPSAVDVVLVNSERWTEYHKAIMDALAEGVRMFFATAQAPAIRKRPRGVQGESAVRSEKRTARLPSVWSRNRSVPRRQRQVEDGYQRVGLQEAVSGNIFDR